MVTVGYKNNILPGLGKDRRGLVKFVKKPRTKLLDEEMTQAGCELLVTDVCVTLHSNPVPLDSIKGLDKTLLFDERGLPDALTQTSPL